MFRASTEVTPLASVMLIAPASGRPHVSVNGTHVKAPVAFAVLPSPTRSTKVCPAAK